MLVLNEICKTYSLEENSLVALRNVSLSLGEGEICAITGPSGSGKSTLLNVAGLIDDPNSGDIEYFGKQLNVLSEKEKTKFRRDTISYIFQKFHLVPVLTAIENVSLPALLQGKNQQLVIEKSKELLKSVGLEEHSNRQVKFLSGGQRQRVAIARSLINCPKVILADEPTANLDANSGKMVLDLLFSLARQHKIALLIVTHDEKIAERADRRVHLVDGRISSFESLGSKEC